MRPINELSFDKRRKEDIERELAEMIPHYTPEWHMDQNSDDFGSALLGAYTEMLWGTIERLNRVSYKNYIAFLNMVNTKPTMPHQAKTPVVFVTDADFDRPVFIDKKSKLLGTSESTGKEVVFEVTEPLLVSNTIMKDAYMVDVEKNYISQLPMTLFGLDSIQRETPFTLFDFNGLENLQKHILYIKHDLLLDVQNPLSLEMLFEGNDMSLNSRPISCLEISEDITWEYASVSGWVPFDKSYASNNKLILEKDQVLPICEYDIFGIKGKWIRCKCHIDAIKTFEAFTFKSVTLRTSYLSALHPFLNPDILMSDDFPLTLENFSPFGEIFSPYKSFYIASDEVFSKRNARIEIKMGVAFGEKRLFEPIKAVEWKNIMKQEDFYVPKEVEVIISRVIWEYWNGKRWARLFEDKGQEDVFGNIELSEITFSFICPEDMTPAVVDGTEKYWIRARIESVENSFMQFGVYRFPVVEQLKLSYAYESYIKPEALVLRNNGRIDTIDQEDEKSLFKGIMGYRYGWIIGFDHMPEDGPIGIFFKIRSYPLNDRKIKVHWEYLTGEPWSEEWKSLEVIDETDHLSNSGRIVFYSQNDFLKKSLFQSERYWIRSIVEIEDHSLSGDILMPQMEGIFANCTWATQQESISDELLDNPLDKLNLMYRLTKFPVLEESVWVNEFSFLSVYEREQLVKHQSMPIKIEYDSEGQVKKLWVLWSPVNDFFASSIKDRHYKIDRLTGMITFSDGKDALKPPVDNRRNIKVDYVVSSGKQGNLEAFSINKMATSPLGIKQVYNPIVALNGSDAEPVSKTIERGAVHLRHNQRGVAVEDIEMLTREVSGNIRKVKCLSNINKWGKYEHGKITLVILPLCDVGIDLQLNRIREELKETLCAHLPCHLTIGNNLEMIEPAYVQVDLYMDITIEKGKDPVKIKAFIEEALGRFLDADTGNYNKEGWEIGALPNKSVFYSVITEVENVEGIGKLIFLTKLIQNKTVADVDIETCLLPHVMIKNGKHIINIKYTD